MPSHSSALRSPALGEALLTLPEAPERAVLAANLPDALDVREQLSRAHAHAQRRAQAGEDVFRAAFALQGGRIDDMLPLVALEIANTLHNLPDGAGHCVPGSESPAEEPRDDTRGVVAALQAGAVSLVAAGAVSDAVTFLCALLDWPEARSDALLGLAICAIRMERHEVGLVLALDYLKRGGRHPRAHCIAGLCRMRCGNRRAAQNHLALAARAARSDPLFRDELRAAQRLLIALNFSR